VEEKLAIVLAVLNERQSVAEIARQQQGQRKSNLSLQTAVLEAERHRFNRVGVTDYIDYFLEISSRNPAAGHSLFQSSHRLPYRLIAYFIIRLITL